MLRALSHSDFPSVLGFRGYHFAGAQLAVVAGEAVLLGPPNESGRRVNSASHIR